MRVFEDQKRFEFFVCWRPKVAITTDKLYAAENGASHSPGESLSNGNVPALNPYVARKSACRFRASWCAPSHVFEAEYGVLRARAWQSTMNMASMLVGRFCNHAALSTCHAAS